MVFHRMTYRCFTRAKALAQDKLIAIEIYAIA